MINTSILSLLVVALALPACAADCIREVDVDAYARTCTPCHTIHEQARTILSGKPYCHLCHEGEDMAQMDREHQTLVTGFAGVYVRERCEP